MGSNSHKEPEPYIPEPENGGLSLPLKIGWLLAFCFLIGSSLYGFIH